MNAEQMLVEKLNEFRSQFTYKYVGGGYFRDMTVPKGTNADIIHGDEIINKFCDDLVKHLTDDHAA
ncbi:MAG: hypothetical protein ABSF38_12020 [Verrucomicrobiota bacterium]|jgi:hypothetical protein